MLFTKKNYLILSLVAITFISCKKNDTLTNQQPEDASSLDKIKVNSSFNWSTYNNIDFSVKGIPGLSAEKNILSVTSTDGKTVFLTGNYSMSDNIKVNFKLPKIVDEVKISFGSISKIIPIKNNKIDFSYISDVPQGNN